VSVQWYIASVLTGVGRALEPLVDALDSPEAFADFLADFGYQSLVTHTQQVEAGFALVKQAYDALESSAQVVNDLRGQSDPDAAAIIDAVKALGAAAGGVMKAIDGLKGTTGFAALPAPLNQERFWKDFPPELAGALLHLYLETEKPRLFAVLTVLGILSVEDVDAASLPAFRKPYRRRQVNWERIGLIVAHPDQLLSKVYDLGSTFQHGRFIGNLLLLADAFGFPAARTELSGKVLADYYGGNAQGAVRQLIAPLYWDAVEIGQGYGYASLDLIVAPIPPAGDPGGAPSGFVFFPVLRGHAGQKIEIAPNVSAALGAGSKAPARSGWRCDPRELRSWFLPGSGWRSAPAPG
jgi:hypothetical protein